MLPAAGRAQVTHQFHGFVQFYPGRQFIFAQAVAGGMVFPVISGAAEYVAAFAFELQFFPSRLRQDQAGAEAGQRCASFDTVAGSPGWLVGVCQSLRAHVLAPRLRCCRGLAGDNTVDVQRPPRRDVAGRHVGCHRFRRPLQRVAVTAAALPGILYDVAGIQRQFVLFGRENLRFPCQAVQVDRFPHILQLQGQFAPGVFIPDVGLVDDHGVAAHPRETAELAVRNRHFHAVGREGTAQALHAVGCPRGAGRAPAAPFAVPARIREEGAVQEQHGAVDFIVLDIRDVRPGRDEAAGLVQSVGERAGAAAADLGVDQLVAERLAVLVGIAGKQRRHGAVGDTLGVFAARFRKRQ